MVTPGSGMLPDLTNPRITPPWRTDAVWERHWPEAARNTSADTRTLASAICGLDCNGICSGRRLLMRLDNNLCAGASIQRCVTLGPPPSPLGRDFHHEG